MGNLDARHTQDTPIQVDLTNTQVTAGGTDALALARDGTAWGWGNNNTGQLGDGGTCGKTCPTPVKITGLTGVTALAGGYSHSLAALTDGTMRGRGRNAEGELGDGTTTVRTIPVTVNGLSGIQPGTKATYTYNGDGLRATRTSGQATQTFTWNQAPVPLLLSDGTTDNLYDDHGLPIEQIDGTGGTSYYSHDQYGSTRVLSDSAGAVTATFSYTPYGALTGKTGTTDTPLRWNAQYQDTATGLYYLRARYYDPATTQFLTRDPLAALTQQSYGYAGDNPLTFVDPLGLDWWNPSTWSSDTWEAIGVGLGVVALAATGVGLAVDLTGAAALATGGIAFGAGLGATALDYQPCMYGESLACGGLIMGGIRSLCGGGGYVLDNFWGFEGSELIAKGLNIQAMLIGAPGPAWTGMD